MIFNNEAYEEVYPRVAPAKLPPKKQTILPDDEDDIIEEGEIEVEETEAPETDPEEGGADESGTGDPVS